MDEILKKLLNALERIGESSDEVYDSEVREQMSNAIFDGFIRPMEGFALPDQFGLYSESANAEVKSALDAYITAANAKASEAGISAFHQRLSAFQNPEVESDGEGAFYDDFFGYSSPNAFDQTGNVIEVQ